LIDLEALHYGRPCLVVGESHDGIFGLEIRSCLTIKYNSHTTVTQSKCTTSAYLQLVLGCCAMHVQVDRSVELVHTKAKAPCRRNPGADCQHPSTGQAQPRLCSTVPMTINMQRGRVVRVSIAQAQRSSKQVRCNAQHTALDDEGTRSMPLWIVGHAHCNVSPQDASKPQVLSFHAWFVTWTVWIGVGAVAVVLVLVLVVAPINVVWQTSSNAVVARTTTASQ
jgi:hypothetical protein